jgi:hypothetical protein
MSDTDPTTAGARTQHTPGPWIVSGDTKDMAIVGTSPFGGGMVVCYLANSADIRNEFTKYEQPIKADARLIAAAPDLLEELIKTNLFLIHVVAALPIPKDSSVLGLLNGHIELNRAAIAKAEGKS